MKRKKSIVTDLRSFLAIPAAKKKQPESERESVTGPPSNESRMQMVVFQGQSDSETKTTETETPITEDDEFIPPLDESECSEDDNSDEYNLKHDPRLRAPISSYPVNDQDLVRRAYIVIGPCRPSMKKENFPQHKCEEKFTLELAMKVTALRLMELKL
ncbi:hypothetical protein QOZ80_1BG0080060 [Eleusine coracana subsp. coracana]|nr:hypothetical protein QOZ80_1BG0080060 [Eleusine coracana subsp. coracana]